MKNEHLLPHCAEIVGNSTVATHATIPRWVIHVIPAITNVRFVPGADGQWPLMSTRPNISWPAQAGHESLCFFWTIAPLDFA